MPTIYYLEKERGLVKTHVTLELEGTADGLVKRVFEESEKCLQRDTKSSWIMPVGVSGFAVGSSDFRWSVEEVSGNSTRWVALRMDSQFHSVPFAFEVRDMESHKVEVVVYRANSSKRDQIAAFLSEGSILCRFREISYPFD